MLEPERHKRCPAAPVGRRSSLRAIILCGFSAFLALIAMASPAAAAPGDPGSEGSTPSLAQVLDETARAYLDAQAVLDASKTRQSALTKQLTIVETQLALANASVSSIASAAYRSGGLRTAAALLSSTSPDSFVERATSVDWLTRYSDQQLRHLNKLKREQGTAKAAIDAEVALQQKQFDVLAKQKDAAERALAAAGGRAIGGFVSATSPAARPAPRLPNGSWAAERCIVDDPTTTGCLTGRTLHAYNEAKRNGFDRFAGCYRSGGPYEHPKGRACDFSVQRSGFGGTATGEAMAYGSNLAMFFVRNANALGVLYVIWYQKIWHPGTGWRTYGGCCDPASRHTNHVHLSVY
jgi:hypothetical protein